MEQKYILQAHIFSLDDKTVFCTSNWPVSGFYLGIQEDLWEIPAR
jgi:hypothetical protein